MKHYFPLAEGIMADLSRDFWIRETGTGQQVAQLHDRYMIIIIISIIIIKYKFVNIRYFCDLSQVNQTRFGTLYSPSQGCTSFQRKGIHV